MSEINNSRPLDTSSNLQKANKANTDGGGATPGYVGRRHNRKRKREIEAPVSIFEYNDKESLSHNEFSEIKNLTYIQKLVMFFHHTLERIKKSLNL